MKLDHVAFLTTTVLAAGTIASAVGVATVAGTVATIAYSILAIVTGAVGIASITAWLDKDSIDASSYFSKLKSHAGLAIAGVSQFVAQTLVTSVVQGLGAGISKGLARKIAGPDTTLSIEQKKNPNIVSG